MQAVQTLCKRYKLYASGMTLCSGTNFMLYASGITLCKLYASGTILKCHAPSRDWMYVRMWLAAEESFEKAKRLETNGANGNILGGTASEGFLGSRSLTLGRIRGAHFRVTDVDDGSMLASYPVSLRGVRRFLSQPLRKSGARRVRRLGTSIRLIPYRDWKRGHVRNNCSLRLRGFAADVALHVRTGCNSFF